ncbi:hypothetical protein CBS101457_005404 [Exobasidium rhododendri]|nr:hypothetical protein CBS101457_005404 [Exobasidium rhododendri]
MSQPAYDPVRVQESPAASPRLPEHDLGSPTFEDARSRPASPGLVPSQELHSPQMRTFSSAQAYAPLSVENPDGMRQDMTRSPSSRPFSPSSFGGYSRPTSMASSHLLGATDYDSTHHLARFNDPNYIQMKDYSDKDQSSTPSTGRDEWDPRAAGIAKYGKSSDGKTPMSRKKKWIIFAAVVLGLVIIAVVVAVVLLKVHDNHNDGSQSSGSGTTSVLATSGSDGSIVQLSNGTNFTYTNNFGGEWRSGLTDNGALAQYYTPRMNESWNYVEDRIFGVNLGGWLVLEPFIVPSLFEKYENTSTQTYVVDEYTLMEQWIKEGGTAQVETMMRAHYDTFITEYDFAQIAAAGLNWVRLPIGYWAITKMDNEPFLEGVAWEYFLKAIQWARKYGIRIELDLHAIPGSQNGYNHGGRLGTFNFLNSPAGLVSAERTLDIIRTLTEFISQPEILNVVPAFGILNEPNIPVGIGLDNIKRFYTETYNIVRNTTGLGQGNGPMIFIHDGFMGLSQYSGFMQGADRVGWDLHPYICFSGPFGGRDALVTAACNSFQANEEQGLTQFGVTIAGEWSLANNDCGLFLNGPFQGVRYDGSYTSGGFNKTGSCAPFDDWQSYNASTKQLMRDGANAQFAAFQNSFFWTWKIGDSLRTGAPVNPNWSYQLGFQQGWMPTNVYNESQNACSTLQSTYESITKTSITWSSTFANYQTGAASTYAPNTSTYTWPPNSIASSGTVTLMSASLQPTYTPTGAHITIAVPTPTISIKNEPVPTIDPWVGGAYTYPAYVAIPGCNYFTDIWSNATAVLTGWPCATGQAAKREYSHNIKKRFPGQNYPLPTPLPQLR